MRLVFYLYSSRKYDHRNETGVTRDSRENVTRMRVWR